jgi:hypothetical protein
VRRPTSLARLVYSILLLERPCARLLLLGPTLSRETVKQAATWRSTLVCVSVRPDDDESLFNCLNTFVRRQQEPIQDDCQTRTYNMRVYARLQNIPSLFRDG